jgi:hypothetical protein
MVETSIWNGRPARPAARARPPGSCRRAARGRAARRPVRGRPSRPARRHRGRRVELLVIGLQLHEQLQHLVVHARFGSEPSRSILLMTTMGCSPSASAFRVTNRVCGMGPSNASTRSSTPSTIRRIRSTSPPKSAWPGVSTMLILCSPHRMDVFFDRIVMPRSRSSGLESITRSSTTWFSRNAPAWRSIWSTSVVLPWSTWAMMATFLIIDSRARRAGSG